MIQRFYPCITEAQSIDTKELALEYIGNRSNRVYYLIYNIESSNK